MKTLGKLLKRPANPRSYNAEGPLVLPYCNLGLEFEFENVLNRELPPEYPFNLWQGTNDPSLKNQGWEFTFNEPMFGKDVVEAVRGLCNHARAVGWRDSKRTGIHVHLDVRDLSPPQLHGLLLTYAITEPCLYRWVAFDREFCIYSMPWYKSDRAVQSVARIMQAAEVDTTGDLLVPYSSNFGRYAGCNLNALAKFGSIEFRHMRTTTNADHVLEWVNLLLHLRRSAMILPESKQTVLTLARDLGPERFLEYAYQDLAPNLMYPEWPSDFHTKGLVTADALVQQAFSQISWELLPLPRGTHPGYALFKEGTRERDPPQPDGEEEARVQG